MTGENSQTIHWLSAYDVAVVMKQLRTQASLTQQQLAQKLEVDRDWINGVERGRYILRLPEFLRWCHACSADPEMVISALTEPAA